MATVDTLPEMLRPLMRGPSVETVRCAVCGRAGRLERHHIVRRSAGRMYRHGVEAPKPTVTLCGLGNAGGCHGLAHANRLHFRWVEGPAGRDWCGGESMAYTVNGGHWEAILLREPTPYLDALEMDGWFPIPVAGSDSDWGC